MAAQAEVVVLPRSGTELGLTWPMFCSTPCRIPWRAIVENNLVGEARALDMERRSLSGVMSVAEDELQAFRAVAHVELRAGLGKNPSRSLISWPIRPQRVRTYHSRTSNGRRSGQNCGAVNSSTTGAACDSECSLLGKRLQLLPFQYPSGIRPRNLIDNVEGKIIVIQCRL